jgi:hypothetical protein
LQLDHRIDDIRDAEISEEGIMLRLIPALLIALVLCIVGVAAQSAGVPTIGNCPVFPADNPWNADVSQYPVDPLSDTYIASISADGDEYLHADFGSNSDYGILLWLSPVISRLCRSPSPITATRAIPDPTPSHRMHRLKPEAISTCW